MPGLARGIAVLKPRHVRQRAQGRMIVANRMAAQTHQDIRHLFVDASLGGS